MPQSSHVHRLHINWLMQQIPHEMPAVAQVIKKFLGEERRSHGKNYEDSCFMGCSTKKPGDRGSKLL